MGSRFGGYKSSSVHVLTLLVLYLHHCILCLSSAQYMYDETLWTKEKWPEYKVVPSLKELDVFYQIEKIEADSGQLVANSLFGPNYIPGLSETGEEAKGLPDGEDSFETAAYIEAAAKTLKCATCEAVAREIWWKAVDKLLAGADTSYADILRLGQQACQKTLLDGVLSANAVLRLDALALGSWGPLVVFVAQERAGGPQAAPTVWEREAVLLSCKEVVARLDEGLAPTIMSRLRMLRDEVTIAQRGTGAGGSSAHTGVPALASANTDADIAAATPPRDDTKGSTVPGLDLRAAGGCADRRPECAAWAASGECLRNPAFMVGTERHAGQCRTSCKACSSEEIARGAALAALNASLALSVVNAGCGGSFACRTERPTGAGAPLANIAQQARALSPRGRDAPEPDQAEFKPIPGITVFPDGFVLGKPFYGIPSVRRAKTPQLSPTRGGAVAPLPQDLEQVLASALRGRELSLPDAERFFVYDFAWRARVRQEHKSADGKNKESYSLGTFAEESVEGNVNDGAPRRQVLEPLDLLPDRYLTMGQTLWPYVRQTFEGGDPCSLRGGNKVDRRAEVRLACSPSPRMHMLIREPEFCSYVVVVYLPELCQHRLTAPVALSS